MIAPIEPPTRPRTRGDCEGGYRPCPWVSCRYHLAVDFTKPRGRHGVPSIIFNLPEDPSDWPAGAHTCALDVADDGPHILDDISAFLGGISRERARQLETGALSALAMDATVEDAAAAHGINTDVSWLAPTHNRSAPRRPTKAPLSREGAKYIRRVENVSLARIMTDRDLRQADLLRLLLASYRVGSIASLTGTISDLLAGDRQGSGWWPRIAAVLGVPMNKINPSTLWQSLQRKLESKMVVRDGGAPNEQGGSNCL